VPQWVTDTLPMLPGIMRETDQRANAVERACADAVEAAVLSAEVGGTFEVIVVDEVRRGDGTELTIKLLEPAVVTRAGGSAELGDTVRAELVTADIATSSVRFEAVAS
ncbi:MAG: RNB domain-containing ribonuclease, partial [Intrasporangiaceae bacterium]|nr:RNB domain-containing ribonuclease [Intrasporangiaceae bacterium]